MQKVQMDGDRLSRENKQQIEIFFNQFLPRGKKKVIRENIQGKVLGKSTSAMQQSSTRSGGLSHEISVFVSEDYESDLSDQNMFVLQELTKQKKQRTLDETWLTSQENFNKDYIRQMALFKHLYAVNSSLFRTPQDLVIVSHEPERHFLFRLIENSKLISSWIKSPDREFYSLDYEYWKGGKDRVRRSFNPDFFIRVNIAGYLSQLTADPEDQGISRLRQLQDKGIEDLILVVEIKSDDDDRDQTRAKGNYGTEHFLAINRRLRGTNPIDLPERFRNSTNQLYGFWNCESVRANQLGWCRAGVG